MERKQYPYQDEDGVMVADEIPLEPAFKTGEIIMEAGQRRWRCHRCGKLSSSHSDDQMIQKMLDHKCSKPKWWKFWDVKIVLAFRR